MLTRLKKAKLKADSEKSNQKSDASVQAELSSLESIASAGWLVGLHLFHSLTLTYMVTTNTGQNMDGILFVELLINTACQSRQLWARLRPGSKLLQFLN